MGLFAASQILENIAKVLDLGQDEVENAFSYWHRMGPAEPESLDPLKVHYLSVQQSIQI